MSDYEARNLKNFVHDSRLTLPGILERGTTPAVWPAHFAASLCLVEVVALLEATEDRPKA
jgi:NADH:ubiquinone oxidoreductase subunit B-like Fe-S oxidoreductase